MNLVDKLDLFMRNKKEKMKEVEAERIRARYSDLKELSENIENSLQSGNTNFLVRGDAEKEIAMQYFSDCRVGCSGDCITLYVIEMTEDGIKRLDKDFRKAREEFENYDE